MKNVLTPGIPQLLPQLLKSLAVWNTLLQTKNDGLFCMNISLLIMPSHVHLEKEAHKSVHAKKPKATRPHFHALPRLSRLVDKKFNSNVQICMIRQVM